MNDKKENRMMVKGILYNMNEIELEINPSEIFKLN